MDIRSLQQVELATLVDCLLEAFEGYFVKMPTDLNYWTNRFKAANVDMNLSYGAFQNDQLVAYIINGIGLQNGERTAFNTGTGVVPAFRGQQLVDKLYAHAIPIFKNQKIRRCSLEVIQANKRAIRVYERIGFTTKRSLHCFKGSIDTTPHEVLVEPIDFKTIVANSPSNPYYSWDHTNEAVLRSKNLYRTYLVTTPLNRRIGYFTIKENGYLAQYEAATTDFIYLINGIKKIAPTVRLVNVDTRRDALINTLLASGLENTINQFEMEMPL